MNRMTEPAHIRFSSPYLVFCRVQRPLLPAHLTNSDREKLLGQNWRKLSKAGRAAYKRGLPPLTASGRGGLRVWAPSPSATVLAGCAAADSVAVSVCASVSAERTAKTAPPSPDPEDQPAAKRRAYPVDQARARGKVVVRAQPLFTAPGHTKRYQAAFALLQHAHSVPPVHPPSRAEPPAPPASRPPLPARGWFGSGL